jgi:hypothetical protein
VLTFKRSGSSCCLGTTRTVRVPLENGLQGGFQLAVCRVLRVFLLPFVRSVWSCAFGCTRFGGQTASWGRTVRSTWTVREVKTDGPLLRVQYWRFGGYFRTVRRRPANSLPRPRGRSPRCLRTVRLLFRNAAKSFASWVALSLRDWLGLVPRVGRSIVTTWPWQARVGILGCEFGT